MNDNHESRPRKQLPGQIASKPQPVLPKMASSRPRTPSTDNSAAQAQPPTKRSYSSMLGGSDAPNKAQKTTTTSTAGALKVQPQQATQKYSPPQRRRSQASQRTQSPARPRRGSSAPPEITVPGSAPQGNTRFSPDLQRQRHPNPAFKAGAIIRAHHYEEHFQQGPNSPPSSPTDKSAFEGPKGRVSCKERIMIVVHAFEEHYIACPLFTFSGNGLKYKKGKIAEEFISIFDHRTDASLKVPQNPWLALETESMVEGIFPLDPQSVVYFTYPVSMFFRHKVVLMGQLTADSVTILRNHYYAHAGRPFEQLRSERAVAARSLSRSPEPESSNQSPTSRSIVETLKEPIRSPEHRSILETLEKDMPDVS